MEYLIIGLGNPGEEYENTRHNVGFAVLDHIVAAKEGVEFETCRHGWCAEYRFKGKNALLLKPNTFMNLSGKALRYWMQEEKIPLDKVLVVTDDLALPYGTLRLRGKGSDGGHNGLKDIQAVLGRNDYARLRFGIGAEFSKGRQVDYVLGEWSMEEQSELGPHLDFARDIVHAFMFTGLNRAMNDYNKRKRD